MSEGVITAWRTTSERAKPGFIRLAVLDILKRKNLHAYGSIKAIRKETMGLWAPSPGSIYPTLRTLTEQGLVKDLGDYLVEIVIPALQVRENTHILLDESDILQLRENQISQLHQLLGRVKTLLEWN